MKTIVLQVPDEVYEECQRMAVRSNKALEECVMEFMIKYGPKPPRTLGEEEAQAAWARLLTHAGKARSGDPHSADNERIDADLTREYGCAHEGEGYVD